MNEEALQYSYNLFTKDGYNGTIEDYTQLLMSDSEAVDYSYNLFSADGYTGDLNQFSELIGLKKKEGTGLPSPVGSLEQPEPVEEDSEAFKKFKANALEMASGISRIPMLVAENKKRSHRF